MYDFHDQVALITGAAGNLGLATAEALHMAGAALALVDISEARLRSLYGDWQPVELLTANLLDEASVTAMAQRAATRFGRIDILINIAGGFNAGTPVHETPLSTWEQMLDLNAGSVFLTSRAVLPIMFQQQRGKIINIAARAALETGRQKMTAYVVSKTAVIRLTEALAAEYREAGINVNCILPGTIDTPRNRADMPHADFTRWVPPADLANVILFLASDLSRAVHGAAIPVTGLS